MPQIHADINPSCKLEALRQVLEVSGFNLPLSLMIDVQPFLLSLGLLKLSENLQIVEPLKKLILGGVNEIQH